jgi:hypothetical protein
MAELIHLDKGISDHMDIIDITEDDLASHIVLGVLISSFLQLASHSVQIRPGVIDIQLLLLAS